MFQPRDCVLLALLLTITLTSGQIKNQGWWKRTIFYQIYPRSFMDSDNDGIGDIKGITSKLEHFKESGVGAIWLSPINRSPMVDFGYDIADFKDIDGIFGTLEDFIILIRRAHDLFIKVILDLVPNHTSDQHYWFNQSVHRQGKYKNYYIWADGKENSKKPPNNWLSVFSGSAWTYNEIRGQWYFHQFERRQPDLNYNNPDVKEEMMEIIEYWLRKGVDGFRVDAVPHLFETNYTWDEPRSFIPGVTPDDYNYLSHTLTKDQEKTYELVKSWRKILDDYADRNNEDEKVMMTEAYTTLTNTMKFYNYGSHIPFNFNFIMNANANSNATAFKNIIDEWMKAMPKNGTANWVMGNHDRSRTASRYPDRGDQMTMLAMILPGVAVTYYGEEIGMIDKDGITWEETQDPQACNAGKDKFESRSRDPYRTPFQWNYEKNAGFSKAGKTWLPVNENYGLLNLMSQREISKESHYKIYCALTTLRNTSKALQSNGSLTTEVINGNDILLVLRQTDEEAVILLINFSNGQQIDLTKIEKLAKFSNKGVVKVASLRSGLTQDASIEKKFILPKTASTVLLFTISGAAEYVASLQTILLSMLFSIITLYK